MFYDFPRIEHIDQVQLAILNRPEFRVMTKGDYQVVNYMVSGPGTFPAITDLNSAILRECRGLIFKADGTIMSRPYHKFFNLNERPENQIFAVDWTAKFAMLEKLDGSMIRPIVSDQKLRMATKAGITDTSMQVEDWFEANPDLAGRYRNFCGETMNDMGLTPIFEWCSRRQRIVIDYAEDNLILTALRNTITGEYLPLDSSIVRAYKIPVVGASHGLNDIDVIVDKTRALDDSEGYVLRFTNGHMVKVKSDWYVNLHKTKEAVTREKDVLALLLAEKLDDLLPVLSDTDREALAKYANDFNAGVNRTVEFVSYYVELARVIYSNKADFARFLNTKAPAGNIKPILFAVWDNWGSEKVTPRDLVLRQIAKNIGSQPKVDSVRNLFNAKFPFNSNSED